MLSANNIEKFYGQLQVLKGVSLSIQQGEIVTIVGSSGAGKSTLLHILGTLDRPDKGEVIYDNQMIHTFSEKQLAKFRNQHIGFVFQFHHLLPEFDAIENVCIPAFIQNLNRKDTVNKAKLLLDRLGLSHRLNHKPAELSGGEQQRVAVARALINDPFVVLADEPSGNLDSVNSEELHNLFFQLRKEFNQTFLIVTHNKELAKMSDRSIHMADGLITSDN